MKTTKKLLSLILVFMLTLTALSLAGCSDKTSVDENETNDRQTILEHPAPDTPTEPKPEKIKVLTLAGPTGIGLSKLIDDNAEKKTEYSYDFSIFSAPDQVNPEIIKGDYDIACVPVNLASVLYNKTEGKLGVVGVNTLGVLYMLENGNTINSIADLKGKTIYATGQGANPEYVLRYILAKNSIDPDKDVKIEFLADHAELATKLKENKVAIGMLPEPQVTAATMGSNVRIALDLTKEWDKVSDTALVQGCIIVNNEFASKYPSALKGFLEEYKKSVDFVNNNVDEAAALVEKAGIIPKAAISKKAIPNCNICLVTDKEAHVSIKDMLNILFSANPSSVGGKLPDEEFYK